MWIWTCLTPQASAEDLSIEFLFIFADLWGITLRSNIGGVDIHHRALPVGLPNARFTPAIHWQTEKEIYICVLNTYFLYMSVGIRCVDSRWSYPCGLWGGDICSKRGSIKGENEEEEEDVLFPGWLLNNFCKYRMTQAQTSRGRILHDNASMIKVKIMVLDTM